MFESLKKRLAIKRKEKISERAKYLFQVIEHNNELWLTCNDMVICPMAMFETDPIDTLKTIRELYVSNNKK